MKYAKLQNGKVKIIDAEKPSLNGFGAIVKVEGCGLCGSDIVKIRECVANATKEDAKCEADVPNTILGHEVVGEIVELRSQGTDFKIGDKVVVAHHYPCFECDFCKNESYSMCPTFKATNIYPGGFSEFISVTEGHLKNTVYKIPTGFDPVKASFTEPLACCLRAVRRANVREGASALTLGLGSIGILMAQAARLHGLHSFGYDVKAERQNFAKKFNIEFDENLKYDVIFMTSGSSKALPTALECVKDGGKIVVFSSVENSFENAAYANNDIYYRELSVIGSYSPAPIDLKTACDLIINEQVDLNEISKTYSLDDIQNAINDTISGKIHKAYVRIP